VALYLFTLGFHADHVVRRLGRARDVEGVVLVTVKPAVRAVLEAYRVVAGFCEKVGLPAPKLFEIDVSDPGASAAELVRLLKGFREVVADLSGGMRIAVVLSMLSLIAASRSVDVVVYVSGEREDAPEVRIPLRVVSYLFGYLSDEKRRLIELVASAPGISVDDVARELGRSERTVRGHVGELRKAELVEVEGSALRPTTWVKLVLEA